MPISFYIVCFRLSTENLDGASPLGGRPWSTFSLRASNYPMPSQPGNVKDLGTMHGDNQANTYLHRLVRERQFLP